MYGGFYLLKFKILGVYFIFSLFEAIDFLLLFEGLICKFPSFFFLT